MSYWGSSIFETLKSVTLGDYTETSSSVSSGTPFVFTHEVVFDDPSFTKDEYWMHAMEPPFDYFIYNVHSGDAKPSEQSYKQEDLVVHRETEVEIACVNNFGFIARFLTEENPTCPITYLSKQKKQHDGSYTIVYENQFTNGWDKYIQKMNGMVTLTDHPSAENPNRFVQKFSIEMEISFGWNSGSWISRGVGYVTDTVAVSSIQQTFKEKADLLPLYFSSFKEKMEFRKRITNNDQ